ncbi:MAG: 2'-5' RNA ligase family protein [Gemmatimonadaceae bacterium]
MPETGIFVIAELGGPAGERIAEINRRFDPRLAAMRPPHVTLAGSSGAGPLPGSTPVEAIRAALEPVARTTPPLVLPFGRPHRFMQSDVVVLPLDPHGPIRVLHDRIKASGLPWAYPKFTFTPHATLSMFRELSRERAAELLALRVPEPAVIDRLKVFLTRDPQPATLLLELPLTGEAPVLVAS